MQRRRNTLLPSLSLECLNKGDVDLSLLTHPPTPNASLPLTQTENLKRKRNAIQNSGDTCGSWGANTQCIQVEEESFH